MSGKDNIWAHGAPETNAQTKPERFFVSPNSIGRWYTGAVYNTFPNKEVLIKKGLDSIAAGWLPTSPLIDSDTRVLAVGSCFARNFTLWLAEHGFNEKYPQSPYNALLNFNADFESPAVVAQQFRWAFDEVDASTLLWIDKNRHLIAATEEGKQAVRSALLQTDVLILTLGLSEVWYDNHSGEPLWRALTDKTFERDRHVFRVETVAQTVDWLQCIERLRVKHFPKCKIIYTLSPIPLKTTFRGISAVTANTISKAILRAAIDEFLRGHENLVNKEIFYFPSYEMVLSYFLDPFIEDNRHPAPNIIGAIINYFARHFCASNVDLTILDSVPYASVTVEQETSRFAGSHKGEGVEKVLLTRIEELENTQMRLQDVCDERLLVIEELDKAAKERLDLINLLTARLNPGNP